MLMVLQSKVKIQVNFLHFANALFSVLGYLVYESGNGRIYLTSRYIDYFSVLFFQLIFDNYHCHSVRNRSVILLNQWWSEGWIRQYHLEEIDVYCCHCRYIFCCRFDSIFRHHFNICFPKVCLGKSFAVIDSRKRWITPAVMNFCLKKRSKL